MSKTSVSSPVPDSILRKLQMVRQRKLIVQAACAVVAALAVLLAAMCVAMFIDWLATLYDSRWRVVLTVGALLAAIATTFGWFAVAWRRALGVERVAGDVDRQLPQLEERWTTMTRLGEDATNPNVVHPAMLRRVATEAASWEPHVEPTQVVSLSTLMLTMVFLTAITAILAVAVVLDTRQTLILVRRFWAPGSSISATQLVDVPGDVVIGRGEPLALAATLEGKPVEQATLFLNSAEDNERAVKLVAHGNDRVEFSHRMRAVEEPFEYRFRAGDGQTEWYSVSVADRPEIAKLQVTVTPPKYTGRPAQAFDHLPRRISAMEKSRFEVALQPTMPVERAELRLNGDQVMPLVADEKGWLRWTTTLDQALSLTPILTESHGLTNRRAPRCDVAVYPDKPPAVKVIAPDNEMAVRPDDTIQITFAASDDVGIGSAELLVYETKPGSEPTQVAAIPIPLDAPGAQSIQETVELDLNKFKAQDGAELSYEVRVREQRGQAMPQASGPETLLASNSKAAAESSSQPANNSTTDSTASKQADSGLAAQPSTKSQTEAPDSEATASNDANRTNATPANSEATPDSTALANNTAVHASSTNANDAGSSSTATPSSDGTAPPTQPTTKSASSPNSVATAENETTPDSAAVAKNDAPASEANPNDKTTPDSTTTASSAATPNNSATPNNEATAANSATPPNSEPTASSQSTPSNSATASSSSNPSAASSPSNAASPKDTASAKNKTATASSQPSSTPASSSPTSATPKPEDLAAMEKPQTNGDSPADGKAMPTPPPAIPPGQPKSRPGDTAMANGKSEKSDAQRKTDSASDNAARTATSGRKGINSDDKSNPDQEAAMAENAESPEKMAENPASESPSEQQQSQANNDEQLADSNKQAGDNQEAGAKQEQNNGEQQANASQQANANQQSDGKQQPSDQQQSSSQQQSAAGSQMASKDQKQPSSPSDPPPGNSMSKRTLDVQSQSQSSTSQRMRLKVDKWAGSFSGQQRAKLEIAVAPELEALDEMLAKAERTARGVMDQLKSNAEWRASHEREVNNAEKSTIDAQGIIEILEKRTKGTPYAFVGLQVVEIGLAHVEPARNGFWKALESEGDGRAASVGDALQHLSRARALLKDLRGQFERTRREFQLAESTEKVKKMYQVFVENSLALLQTQDSDPDRYNRKMAQFDLDDEYLKRLKEVLEMRAELQKELARILSDDPRLLRRFMDALRNRSNSLREELADLVERQNELNREVRAWALVEEPNRPQIAKALLMRHAQRTAAMATATGKLQERYETWLPLNREVKDTDLAVVTKRIQAVATAADELNAEAGRFIAAAQPGTASATPSEAEAPESAPAAGEVKPQAADAIAVDGLDPMLADAQTLYDELSQLDVALRQIAAREDDPESATFAANRLVDTRKLIADSSAWLRQMRAHKAGNYTGAAEVDQYRLAMKTEELAGKLGSIEQQLAAQLQSADGTLPQPIAAKAREFLTTLDREASPNQLAAVYALHGNVFPRATDRQQAAGTALEKAEKLYDELMKLAIAELDKLPVQDPIADLLDDPTLDELLTQLEQERQLEELLGIPTRPSNLRIINDWMQPGRGGGGGGGGMAQSSGAMMRNQVRQDEQRARRQLDRTAQRAIARAQKETEKMPKVELPKPAKLSDWNRLVSELGDDLRQGRDKAPPEQYRRAIEQYFSQISRAVAEKEKPKP